MNGFDFVNLTPYPAEIHTPDGRHLSTVAPSGSVAFATVDPPRMLNVPPPKADTVYIVLPAVADAGDREDLVPVEPDEALRSPRGNIKANICYWSGRE